MTAEGKVLLADPPGLVAEAVPDDRPIVVDVVAEAVDGRHRLTKELTELSLAVDGKRMSRYNGKSWPSMAMSSWIMSSCCTFDPATTTDSRL